MKKIIAIVTVLMTVFISNSFAKVDDNTLLYLSFDEGKGKLASDASKYKNDGMLLGAKWVDGKIGNAIGLDKVDSVVEIANTGIFDFGSDTDFTIEFWLKVDPSSHPRWYNVFSTGGTNTNTTNPGAIIGLSNSFKVCVRFSDGNNRVDLISRKSWLNDGMWHHIAVVANRKGDSILFIDQKEEAKDNISGIGSIDNISFPLQLGGKSHIEGDFNICIDELKISNSIRLIKPSR